MNDFIVRCRILLEQQEHLKSKFANTLSVKLKTKKDKNKMTAESKMRAIQHKNWMSHALQFKNKTLQKYFRNYAKKEKLVDENGNKMNIVVS